MPRVAPESRGEWRGVLVVAEHTGKALRPITRELLSKGHDLAERLGTTLSCAVLAQDPGPLVKEAIAFGADRVFCAQSPLFEHYNTEPYTDLLAPLILKERPEALLVGGTRNGRDLAGRLAVRLKTGIGADSTDIRVNTDTRNLEMVKPAFGGLILAAIVCENHRPQIATARPNVFSPLPPDWKRMAEVVRVEVPERTSRLRTRVVRESFEAEGRARIEDAKVVVCVGRGIGSVERVETAAELARHLTATLASTRPVADLGWVPHSQMIGQTGAFVRPSVYIAFGVSGQVAHTVGLSGTRTIAAVNKDPKAPIFSMADIAVEGDVSEILPAFLDEVKRRSKAAPPGAPPEAPRSG